MMQIKGSEQQNYNLIVNFDSTSKAMWQCISWKFWTELRIYEKYKQGKHQLL